MSTQPRANNPPEPAKEGLGSAETQALAQKLDDTGRPPGLRQPPSTSAGMAGHQPTPPLIGQAFDDLELLEEIGRGGMGLVFKGRQKSLDRIVAVKLLPNQHFGDPLKLARFMAEARAAASLHHPNIVQVYHVGAGPLGYYFAMEYIDGSTLESVIHKGTHSFAFTVQILKAVAKAVHFAHTKGIVHRDLKPANIMIDRSQRPVVMDFGIVKFVGQPSSLTQDGVIVGTPTYMAPEQAGASSEQVGPLSDVYSLGGILYSMLTGRVPYDGGTPLATILKVIGPEMPPAVRALRPTVPAELERICMKCLSKRQVDRYSSALELARDLRRASAMLTPPQAGSRPTQIAGAAATAAKAFSVRLVAVASGKHIRIRHEKATLGRSAECDIIVRAADISKCHCRILVGPDRVVVEDLGSANGTFVNGRRVEQARLQDGDRLRIADHEFEVQLDPPKQ